MGSVHTMASGALLTFILLFAAHCAAAAALPPLAERLDLETPSPPTLSWAYTAATNTVSIAFTDAALTTDGWVAWGINLHAAASMSGADVLIATRQQLRLYKLTPALYSAAPPPLASVTAFDDGLEVLNNMTVEVRNATLFTIRATLRLPPGVETINTIYNRGPMVAAVVAAHGVGQRNGMKSIHLATGKVTSEAVKDAAAQPLLRGVHAALAAASWGILLPIGAMVGRYARLLLPPPPASQWWFYAHTYTQCAAYLGGTAAWALGLHLGSLSPSVVYRSHRSLGIALFALATLQVAAALFARPHKVAAGGAGWWRRRVWEVVHRATAAAILIVAVVNVFKGFDILQPSPKYRAAYIAFLTLGACAGVALEAHSWHHYFLVQRPSWRYRSDQNGAAGTANMKQPTAPPYS